MDGRKTCLMVVSLVATVGCCSGFLQSPEGQEFFTAYVSAIDVMGINIFLPANRQGEVVPVGMLRALWLQSPLSVALQQVRSSKEVKTTLEALNSNTLNVAFLNTPEDLSLFVEVTLASLVRRHLWLVMGDTRLVTDGDHKPRLPLDNLVTFATVNTTNLTKVDLVEVYSVSDDLPYTIRQFGSWRAGGPVRLSQKDWSDRRSNLTGLHLRCVTLPQQPFTYLSEPDSQMNVQITGGYTKDVWDALQEIHGFTYSCRVPEDGKWGALSDGKWNGLVQEMVEQRADAVVSSLDHTGARAKAVHFVTGLREVGYRLVVRRPGLMDQTWTSFTSELLPDAWLGTMAFVLLAPPCLVLCAHYSPLETEKVTLKDAYILAVGAFAIQGSWLDVRSISSRIVFITIFLATLVVYAHYTSALVSLLTVASTNTGFSTLQALLQDGSFQFGFISGTSLEVEFRNADQWLFKEVWERLVVPDPLNLVTTHQEGINKVINERYVYMMEENEFRAMIGNQCQVVLTKSQYFSTQTGFAVATDSPLKKVFDTQLLRMRDGGVLSRSWQKWQPPPALCTDQGVVALDLSHLFTAFLLLVLGVVLAVIILPCERLHWKVVGGTKAARSKQLFSQALSQGLQGDSDATKETTQRNTNPIRVAHLQEPGEFITDRGFRQYTSHLR
ncbi:Glutamate receptor ionotropic, kainate 2-like 15 [Homarus americanus]|uniref:Glutamate receptor ionotropic, kainate 2-like 15 n=1 Tax=Homarus americanus TaxID=6706 RepID=A0A8J5JN99_HOMAM|nr:Glutamate receptor ionotropic, kainate 2-like 15 [Homarus americanus]